MRRPFVFAKRRFPWIILTVTAAKAILMVLTPLSLDLSFMVSEGLQTPMAKTPYGAFLAVTVMFWQLLPISHPALTSVWTVDYFKPSAELYLLVFLTKLPSLILDILTGFVLYCIAKGVGRGPPTARLAFYVWYLNPYVFLVNEMWAAVDLLPALLTLLAVAMVTDQKHLPQAGIALFAAIAAKLLPVILVPTAMTLGNRRATILFAVSGIIGVLAYFGWMVYAGLNPWLQLLMHTIYTQHFDEFTLITPLYGTLGLASFFITIAYVLMAWKWPRSHNGMFDASLTVLLLFLGFSRGFPQYVLLLIPFLTLDLAVEHRNPWYMVVLLSSAFLMNSIGFYAYFTANGNAFFFVPASTSLLKSFVTGYTNLARDNLMNLLTIPIAQALFTSTCIAYALRLINGRTAVISILISSFKTQLTR